MSYQIDSRKAQRGTLSFAASATTPTNYITTLGCTQLVLELTSEFNGDTLTMQGSSDGTNFSTIYFEGAAISFVAATGFNIVNPLVMPIPYVRFSTGSSTAAAATVNYSMLS